MPPIFTLKSSYRYAKPWSPPSRDPRFSRRTPDAFRARIVAASLTGATVGDRKAWAAAIVHAKARKTPTNNPARARLIEQMMKMATVVEKEQVDATREVELCSPSAAMRDSRQETAVCQPPQRSVFGSEACAAVVDSPVTPLGRLL